MHSGWATVEQVTWCSDDQLCVSDYTVHNVDRQQTVDRCLRLVQSASCMAALQISKSKMAVYIRVRSSASKNSMFGYT